MANLNLIDAAPFLVTKDPDLETGPPHVASNGADSASPARHRASPPYARASDAVGHGGVHRTFLRVLAPSKRQRAVR